MCLIFCFENFDSYINNNLFLFWLKKIGQEIEAESAAANPLVGANYVSLGCESCSYVKALSSCAENYHLCSYSELYSGAYLLARKNGWFKFNTDVWARESLAELEKIKENESLGDPNILKLSLCCSDR